MSDHLDAAFLTSLLPEDHAEAAGLLDDLIQACSQSAAELVSTLLAACHAKDAATLRQAAHSLKGAGLSLGARRLAEICLDVESRTSEQDWPALESRVKDAQLEVSAVERDLRVFRKDIAGP